MCAQYAGQPGPEVWLLFQKAAWSTRNAPALSELSDEFGGTTPTWMVAAATDPAVDGPPSARRRRFWRRMRRPEPVSPAPLAARPGPCRSSTMSQHGLARGGA